MASNVAFVQSVPALRAHAMIVAQTAATAPVLAPSLVSTSESQASGYGLLCCATLAVAAAGTQRAHRSKAPKQHRPRLALRAVVVADKVVPLTGCTLQAALKMRCDTSGAGYAIYWANETGKLVVAGDYVTDARRAELSAKGLEKSFAEESETFALDASADGPVATVYKSKQPLMITDIASSNMKRKDLAAKYGLGQICFIPFEGGVLEFGTSDGSASATWGKMPTCPCIPKAALRKGFENLGASYAMFWAKDGCHRQIQVWSPWCSLWPGSLWIPVVRRGDQFVSAVRGRWASASGECEVVAACGGRLLQTFPSLFGGLQLLGVQTFPPLFGGLQLLGVTVVTNVLGLALMSPELSCIGLHLQVGLGRWAGGHLMRWLWCGVGGWFCGWWLWWWCWFAACA